MEVIKNRQSITITGSIKPLIMPPNHKKPVTVLIADPGNLRITIRAPRLPAAINFVVFQSLLNFFTFNIIFLVFQIGNT